MGEYLRDNGLLPEFGTIFVSPQPRAVKTAGNIMATFGKPMTILFVEALKERALGRWEGETWKSIEGTFQYQMYRRDKYRYKEHGGDSYAELHQRLRDLWDEWASVWIDQPMLIISHQTTIAVLDAVIRGVEWNEGNKIKHNELLKVDPQAKTAERIDVWAQ
jgi:broad specificity phosphatase PhoE